MKNSFWKTNKYYDNEIISEYDKDLSLILDYDAELKDLCNNNRIKYISMQEVLQKEDFIDGLHPNHNGHKKFLKKSLIIYRRYNEQYKDYTCK